MKVLFIRGSDNFCFDYLEMCKTMFIYINIKVATYLCLLLICQMSICYFITTSSDKIDA